MIWSDVVNMSKLHKKTEINQLILLNLISLDFPFRLAVMVKGRLVRWYSGYPLPTVLL